MIRLRPEGILCPVCTNPIPDEDVMNAELSEGFVIISFKCWACKMDFVLSISDEQL